MSISNANFAVFDGNNLASVVPGLTVLAVDPYKAGKRKLSIDALARQIKRKTSAAFWNEKNITVHVGISRNTRDDLEQSLDLLYGYLQGLEKDLLVPQAGSTRRYITTLSDIPTTKGGTAYWEGDLIFACSDSYGYDTAYTIIAQATNFTGPSKFDNYTFGGSADFQAPFIRIAYSSVVATGRSTVYVGNVYTQQIQVTRVWSNNDVLEIDGVAETVKVNGTEVAFVGSWPRFQRGPGILGYSDNFTSRTFNQLAYYYKRYS